MSELKDFEHLFITKKNQRQPSIYQAKVNYIQDPCEDIRIIRLKIEDKSFSFKAGQWVDFFVPGIKQVAGYSITSGPHQFTSKGYIELAVKGAGYPPTDWVSKECKIGDTVSVRVGGDYYFDPDPQTFKSQILLIAGGVGINPLSSILRHFHHITSQKCQPNPRLELLYSAKTTDSLIFKDTFDTLCKQNPNIECQYFVTREQKKLNEDVHYRKLSKQDIDLAIQRLKRENLLCYICGPKGMVPDTEKDLLELDIKPECIIYEKWW